MPELIAGQGMPNLEYSVPDERTCRVEPDDPFWRMTCTDQTFWQNVSTGIWNIFDVVIRDIPIIGWLWEWILNLFDWNGASRERIAVLKNKWASVRLDALESASHALQAAVLRYLESIAYGPLVKLCMDERWFALRTPASESVRINDIRGAVVDEVGRLVIFDEASMERYHRYEQIGLGSWLIYNAFMFGLDPVNVSNPPADIPARITGVNHALVETGRLNQQINEICEPYAPEEQMRRCKENLHALAVWAGVIAKAGPADPTLGLSFLEQYFEAELTWLRARGYMPAPDALVSSIVARRNRELLAAARAIQATMRKPTPPPSSGGGNALIIGAAVAVPAVILLRKRFAA